MEFYSEGQANLISGVMEIDDFGFGEPWDIESRVSRFVAGYQGMGTPPRRNIPTARYMG